LITVVVVVEVLSMPLLYLAREEQITEVEIKVLAMPLVQVKMVRYP